MKAVPAHEPESEHTGAFIWFLSSEFLSVQAFRVMTSSFRSPSTAKEPGVL
jgi:hypothetical protein